MNSPLQREGYAQAIVSKEFLQALKSGPHGKIAITYFEWAASNDQKIIIPWRIDRRAGDRRCRRRRDHEDADPPRVAHLDLGRDQLRHAAVRREPAPGLRRVIDISGDGPNNNGEPVVIARDAALAKGVVINGLPIMVKEPSYSTMDIDDLDLYYEDCVIGGPGSFVVPIKERDKFKEAIRTKLLLEIAGRTPERPVVPAAGREARVNCMIGEKIWQDRWGR